MSALPWMVTTEQVHALHRMALEQWGGLDGVRDENCPDRSIHAALLSADYRAEGGEVSPVVVAAHLLWFFAKNHCFVDGNKRVAWSASQTLLAGIGLAVDAPEDEAAAFVVEVVEAKLAVETVIEWFTRRLIARG